MLICVVICSLQESSWWVWKTESQNMVGAKGKGVVATLVEGECSQSLSDNVPAAAMQGSELRCPCRSFKNISNASPAYITIMDSTVATLTILMLSSPSSDGVQKADKGKAVAVDKGLPKATKSNPYIVSDSNCGGSKASRKAHKGGQYKAKLKRKDESYLSCR